MAISEERLRELAEKMAAIMQRVESEHTSAAPTPSNVVRLVPRAAVPREPLPLDAIAQARLSRSIRRSRYRLDMKTRSQVGVSNDALPKQ